MARSAMMVQGAQECNAGCNSHMSSFTGVCCISRTSGDITATPLTLSDCSTSTRKHHQRAVWHIPCRSQWCRGQRTAVRTENLLGIAPQPDSKSRSSIRVHPMLVGCCSRAAAAIPHLDLGCSNDGAGAPQGVPHEDDLVHQALEGGPIHQQLVGTQHIYNQGGLCRQGGNTTSNDENTQKSETSRMLEHTRIRRVTSKQPCMVLCSWRQGCLSCGFCAALQVV